MRRIDRASTFYNLCIFSSFFVFVSFVFCVYSWQSSKRLRGGLIGQTQCTKILHIFLFPCLLSFVCVSCKAGTEAVRRIDQATTLHFCIFSLCVFFVPFVFVSFFALCLCFVFVVCND